jgi:hypothetical protein
MYRRAVSYAKLAVALGGAVSCGFGAGELALVEAGEVRGAGGGVEEEGGGGGLFLAFGGGRRHFGGVCLA